MPLFEKVSVLAVTRANAAIARTRGIPIAAATSAGAVPQFEVFLQRAEFKIP
jgi:hypothetical protein